MSVVFVEILMMFNVYKKKNNQIINGKRIKNRKELS